MNSAGFFGAAVLIASLALVLQAHSFSSGIAPEYAAAETGMAGMAEISFRRAEAEIFLDNAIRDAMDKSLYPPVDPERTKAAVNARIIESFGALGMKAFICEAGETAGEQLTADGLAEITKAIAVKIMEATHVEYIVAGNGGGRICAIIAEEDGEYSLALQLPHGYRISRTVPWA